MATFEEQYAAMIKRQLGGMLVQYKKQRENPCEKYEEQQPRGRDGYRTNKPSLPKLLSEFQHLPCLYETKIVLPEEDPTESEEEDPPHHFCTDLKDCEFAPMAQPELTGKVFRNEEFSGSDAEDETFGKDYYNDDGQLIEDFEEILHRPDDLSLKIEEDVVDEQMLKGIFEKMSVQIQSQLRKDEELFDRGHSPDQISFIYEQDEDSGSEEEGDCRPTRFNNPTRHQMDRDTPVFEEDGESDEDEENDIDVRINLGRNNASELPPSRVNGRMPLHKKILSESQQDANIMNMAKKESDDQYLSKNSSTEQIDHPKNGNENENENLPQYHSSLHKQDPEVVNTSSQRSLHQYSSSCLQQQKEQQQQQPKPRLMMTQGNFVLAQAPQSASGMRPAQKRKWNLSKNLIEAPQATGNDYRSRDLLGIRANPHQQQQRTTVIESDTRNNSAVDRAKNLPPVPSQISMEKKQIYGRGVPNNKRYSLNAAGVMSAQSGGSLKRSPQRPKGGVIKAGNQYQHPARQTAQQKVNYAYGGNAAQKNQNNQRRGLFTGQQDLAVARSAQKQRAQVLLEQQQQQQQQQFTIKQQRIGNVLHTSGSTYQIQSHEDRLLSAMVAEKNRIEENRRVKNLANNTTFRQANRPVTTVHGKYYGSRQLQLNKQERSRGQGGQNSCSPQYKQTEKIGTTSQTKFLHEQQHYPQPSQVDPQPGRSTPAATRFHNQNHQKAQAALPYKRQIYSSYLRKEPAQFNQDLMNTRQQQYTKYLANNKETSASGIQGSLGQRKQVKGQFHVNSQETIQGNEVQQMTAKKRCPTKQESQQPILQPAKSSVSIYSGYQPGSPHNNQLQKQGTKHQLVGIMPIMRNTNTTAVQSAVPAKQKLVGHITSPQQNAQRNATQVIYEGRGTISPTRPNGNQTQNRQTNNGRLPKISQKQH